MSNDTFVKIGKYEASPQPEADPETVRTAEHPPGFADLAGYLASDCERSIYKRFRWLTARSLLMMQDEITGLEQRIREWDLEDRMMVESHDEASTLQLRGTLSSWESLVESAKTNTRDAEKLQVYNSLRTLLAAYQAALLAECQVLAIKSPPKRLLRDFKAFLQRKHGILTGRGRRYEELRRFEFVSLDTEEDPDRMTDMVESTIGWFNKDYFRDKRPEIPASWGNVHDFSNEKTWAVVGAVNVLLAAGIMIGAMILLRGKQTEGARLAIVSVFTLVFSAGVGLLTNAKRNEVYATTAGYAAVLVVYVTNSFSSNGSKSSSAPKPS